MYRNQLVSLSVLSSQTAFAVNATSQPLNHRNLTTIWCYNLVIRCLVDPTKQSPRSFRVAERVIE